MRGIISWPSALAERIGRRLRTRRISVSPLFDPDWYLEVYADVAEARVDPAVHYLARGSQEGRKPHPLFDPGWYLHHHPDVRERNKSTLECYLSMPPAERRYAHPLFDADFYRESYPDIAEAGADPLVHYLTHGAAEGRQPHPEFDPGWYLLNHPNVDRVGVNPLVHYLAEGVQAGLDPSPGFSSSEYLEMYPDVAEARVNPLVHYVVRGKREGRFPTQAARRTGCVRLGADIGIAAQRELIKNSPLFDPEWYLARYPDVGESHTDALNHFLLKGRSEKRNPSPWFDTGWYLEHYAEAAQSNLSPLVHHELVGRDAGHRPRPRAVSASSWDETTETPAHQMDVGRVARPAGAKMLPRVLYVIAALPENAGTTLTNRDLMDALESHVESFLLKSDGRIVELFRYRAGELALINYAVLSNAIRAFPHASREYDRHVTGWMEQYAIELIHIRHLAQHSLGLIASAHSMSIPVVFSLHDFYTICPTVKLLDERREFCGGTCTAGPGHCVPELWPDAEVPELKHAAVHDWKAHFAEALAESDLLICTSSSARQILLQNFPMLSTHPFEVIAHGRDFEFLSAPPHFPVSTEPFRIVLPGSLTAAKGSALVAALAEQHGELNIEVHVLGRWLDGPSPPGVVVHGPYERSEFADRVQGIGAHAGAVLSIWPETWCHTLTELWAAGLPVLGVRMGAVGERIGQSGAGWLAAQPRSQAIIAQVERIRRDRTDYAEKCQAVIRWQQRIAPTQTRKVMGARYLDQYRRLWKKENERHSVA